MRISFVPSSGSVRSAAVESDSGPWDGLCGGAPRALRQAALALTVSGCSYSPTLNLLGSYFPAWMLCAVVGIAAAVIIRQILGAAGVNEYVVAPLLTYAGLALSATLLAWLFWFGH